MLADLFGNGPGLASAVLRIRTRPWNPKLDEGVEKATAASQSPPSGPAPKVVVDKAEYDFGTLDIEASSGSHDFVFTNKGDAPLSLSEGGTSCRCTMSKLGQEKIPPGGSAKVTITWKPIDKPGPYQQTAKILTNDPARPQITLTISGRVTAAMRFSPPELVFSRLSVGETSTAESRLFCYLDKPLKILGHKWSDAGHGSVLRRDAQPLSAAGAEGGADGAKRSARESDVESRVAARADPSETRAPDQLGLVADALDRRDRRQRDRGGGARLGPRHGHPDLGEVSRNLGCSGG